MPSSKRSVTLDGEIYWSAIDVVAEICGYNAQAASTFITDLRSHEEYGFIISTIVSRTHQFPGQGQRPTPLINAADIEELRKYLPRKPARGFGASKGFVYAAYSEGNGTKIGMTMKDDPKKRLRDGNTYVKHPYELLDFIHCDQPTILEGYIHIQLDDYKVGEHNRELFDLPEDLTMTFFHYIKKELNRGQDVSQDMVSDALTKTLEELQTPPRPTEDKMFPKTWFQMP